MIIKPNKMNFLKLIGVLTLINLTACVQTEKKEVQTKTLDGWKSLTENNFSIHYPDNWELNKSGQMGSSFILFSPLSSEKDQFKENINLIVQDLSGHNLDLDKYVELSENQIKTMITDGNIIDNKRVTTETFNYQKIIYTGKQGILNLIFEQYYWVVENKAYVLTLTCEENEFDNYKTTGEKILNSFKLNLSN